MTTKRFMIRCDIEGVSGVVSPEQAEPGKSEFDFGMRMFRSDLMACIEGLFDGGADEVVVYDEHFHGRNIDLAWLPNGASAICGKPPYRADWAGGLDSSFAGVLLVGFHSKARTPGGLLHHSYEPDIRDLRLNSVSVGEIGMEAAVAGDLGVGILVVTADSAGVAEAEALLPGVRGVAVKESLGETGGHCLPLVQTAADIRQAATDAAHGNCGAAPYVTGKNVTLDIELNNGPYLDAVRRLFGQEMSDQRTLSLFGEGALPLWSRYWAMKLEAQAESNTD